MTVSRKACSPKKARTLTTAYVDGLTEAGDYREQELKGFFVRVTPNGTKTYYVANSVKSLLAADAVATRGLSLNNGQKDSVS